MTATDQPRSRTRDFIDRLKRRYDGSLAQSFAAQLSELKFVDFIIVFGASLLLSVLPFIILMSAFASHRIDADITRHIGLNSQGARIVSQLFQSTGGHPVGATVAGLIFAVAGCVGVAGSLQAIYERVFDLPQRGIRDVLRFVTWVAVLFGVLAAESLIDNTLRGTPGRTVLDGAVAFFGMTAFFWWSMHFLLAGRVHWRVLLPSAVATAIFWIGLEVFAALYFSSTIVSDSRTYGTIGVVFSLMTWFIAIGAVIVLGAVAGATWRQRRRA